MNAGTGRRSALDARTGEIVGLKPALQQTVVEYFLEFLSAAHRIRDRQDKPLRFTRDQSLCFFLRELRSVEADPAAANRCISATAEREIELDRLLNTRHRQLRMPNEM